MINWSTAEVEELSRRTNATATISPLTIRKITTGAITVFMVAVRRGCRSGLWVVLLPSTH
jgi:hypothetical protein